MASQQNLIIYSEIAIVYHTQKMLYALNAHYKKSYQSKRQMGRKIMIVV